MGFNPFHALGQQFGPASHGDVDIVDLPRATNPAVKTGRNAARSEQGRYLRRGDLLGRGQVERAEEIVLPVAGRAERRRADRQQETRRRKGVARWKRAQMAAERAGGAR